MNINKDASKGIEKGVDSNEDGMWKKNEAGYTPIAISELIKAGDDSQLSQSLATLTSLETRSRKSSSPLSKFVMG